MNTHSEYRRHGYQPPDETTAQPEAEMSELSRHRDPQLATQGGATAIANKHVAWIRPTELASYAGPMIGRGIDLEAELIRRTRRAPITAARTVRGPTPTAPIAPTAPPTAANHTEGLQL